MLYHHRTGRRARSCPLFRWLAWRLPTGVVLAIFLAALAAVTSRHEMWRDELHAWLIARDSASLAELLANVGTQGHGAAWYLVLWPLARLCWDPAVMQVLHVGVGTGVAALLLTSAPFPPWLRLALPFGYLFFYEWGVIARDYSLGALLLLLVARLWHRKWTIFPTCATLLGLAAHTTVQALILVVALCPLLLARWYEGTDQERRDRLRFKPRILAGLSVLLFAISTAVWQLVPPEESRQSREWLTDWDCDRLERVAISVVNGVLPLPPAQPRFWNRNLIVEKLSEQPVGSDRGHSPQILLAAALLGVVSVPFWRHPSLLGTFVTGVMGLTLFSYSKLAGSTRHHGFLFLWALLLYWLREVESSGGLHSEGHERRSKPSAAVVVLAPLMALHLAGTLTASFLDWNLPFSNAGPAARWLRTNTADTVINLVGFPSHRISAIVALLPLSGMYYLDRRAIGSYETWSWPRPSLPVVDVFRERLQALRGPVWLVTHRPLHWIAGGVQPRLLAAFDAPSISGEAIFIYAASGRGSQVSSTADESAAHQPDL